MPTRGWQNRPVPTPAGLPAAASAPLRGLLTGPARAAVVRGVFPRALYVDLDGEVVAVVTADALRLPCALVLAGRSSSRPFDRISRGEMATVGDGMVAVGDERFAVRRWWRPRRALTVHPGPALATRTGALAALLPPPPHPLPDRTLAPEHLVGLGPGLTPAGDDFLAAVLLTLTAAPGAARDLGRINSAVEALLPSTTSLSATLLRHAAAGRGIPQVIDVVDAVAGSGELEPAALRLLGVGHSSGPALAHGVMEAIHLINDACADPSTERAA